MGTALLLGLADCTPIFYPVQRSSSFRASKYHKKFLTNVLDILGRSRYEGDNFVLDQQIVRAALKSYGHLFSTKTPSTSSLSPSSYYLRLLLEPSNSPSELADSSWEDPVTSILLLEWRAAAIVHELTQNFSDPDASVIQRVSKAATEAYIAVQVGDIINNLALPHHETHVVRGLYRLVSNTGQTTDRIHHTNMRCGRIVSSHNSRIGAC